MNQELIKDQKHKVVIRMKSKSLIKILIYLKKKFNLHTKSHSLCVKVQVKKYSFQTTL